MKVLSLIVEITPQYQFSQILTQNLMKKLGIRTFIIVSC